MECTVSGPAETQFQWFGQDRAYPFGAMTLGIARQENVGVKINNISPTQYKVMVKTKLLKGYFFNILLLVPSVQISSNAPIRPVFSLDFC